MKGTFIYNEKTRKLTLKRDDGEAVGALGIVLAGDAESTVFGNKGESKQYAHIGLWTNSDGEVYLATADQAPRDWRFNPGKWLANALAVFAPLSRFMQQAEARAVLAFRRLTGKPQPFGKSGGDNRNPKQKYKRPQCGAFVPEFLLHWRHLRHHALNGWSYVLAIVMGWSIGWFLL